MSEPPPDGAKRVLSCKEVSALLSQAQDRPLGMLERVALEAHLKVCLGCENFQRQIDFLRRAIRRHPAVRDEEKDQ